MDSAFDVSEKIVLKERLGSNSVPLERLVNLDQWDVNFWKLTYFVI